MNKHHGHLVEKVIRGNGYSISALASVLKVNRRSIYNWFKQTYLKQEIIYRIGIALGHDFHQEFPELFDPNEFLLTDKNKDTNQRTSNEQADATYWKEKYLNLLEKYNEALNEINNNGVL
jgi:predicted transcriptional regulator